MSEKLEKVRRVLAQNELPAGLITLITNVKWLTGFSGSYGVCVVTKSNFVFISDSRYAEQAHEQVKDAEVLIFQSPRTAPEVLSEVVSKYEISKMGFEADHVTVSGLKKWQEKLESVELVPVERFIDPLRMVKTDEEIQAVRRACGLADACFTHVSRMFQIGVTEYDIAMEIEFYLRRQGAKNAFDPIVVSGERSARPHGEPSERKLQKGDFVTLDFGANLNGYNSDLTRTVFIGEPTEEHKRVYNAVLEAQLGALDMMKPGVKAEDVDSYSREILKKHDLAQYFGHGLGHGLGSTVHDVGRMGQKSEDVLEEGQIWTVEPGAYIPGFGGVRIEDDVVITKDGIDILTKTPKDLLCY